MHLICLSCFFEGLRFRRPGKCDPTSFLAHHPCSFDRAQCRPRRQHPSWRPHPSRRRREHASRRLHSRPSRRPPARPLRRQPPSRRPHQRPSRSQRLRQATRRTRQSARTDRGAARGWNLTVAHNRKVHLEGQRARGSSRGGVRPWARVGQQGGGSLRQSDGVTRVVWAQQVASSPRGQHRIRKKKKRAAADALHTLIN